MTGTPPIGMETSIGVLAAAVEAPLIVDLLGRAGISAHSLHPDSGPAPAGAMRFIDVAGLSADDAEALITGAGTPGPGWILSAPLDAIDLVVTLAGDSGAAAAPRAW